MLAGAAGLIFLVYQTTVWYFSGFIAGLIAFTAAVMGGIGNLQGAVLGGFIIGIIQQLAENRIGAAVDDRRGVRLPDHDHGLPAPGPPGRADEGGRLMATARLRSELAGRRAGAPAQLEERQPPARRARVLRADRLPVLPRPARQLRRRHDPRAGLRGDGAGPEHRGRLRRPARPRLRRLLRVRRVHDRLVRVGPLRVHQQREGHPHLLRRLRRQHAGHPPELPAHPRRRGGDLRRGGRDHRHADAAPARRLHRHRHARLRRDHLPLRGQRRLDRVRQELQADERPPGDLADRPDRPAVLLGVRLRVQPQTVLLVRAGAGRAGAVLQLPPARLAARPRLDRDPGGRGRGGVDGRAARARRS